MTQRRFVTDISKFLKKLLVVMVILCAGVCWADQYEWKNVSNGNWSDSNWKKFQIIGFFDTIDTPGSTDRVYIPNSTGGTITIKLTADIFIDELVIDSDSKGGTVIIDTNGFTLKTNKLYLDNIGASSSTSAIAFKITGGGTVIANNINAPGNMNGKSLDITAESGSLFQTEADISGSNITFTGDTRVQNDVTGIYTVTFTPEPARDTTVTVTVTNDRVSFQKLYLDITISNIDATTTETFTINGTSYTTTTIDSELDFGTSATSQSFTIVIPATMDYGESINVKVKDANKSVLKNIYFEYNDPDSVYENGSWNVLPHKFTKTITIKDDFTVPDATFFSNCTSLESLKIEDNKTLNVSAIPNFELNTNHLSTESEGTLKSTGTVSLTTGSNFTAENLIINAGTITATSKHLKCHSVNTNYTNLTGNSAVNTANTTANSSFGAVTCNGSQSTNIDCAGPHTISSITLNGTSKFYIWGYSVGGNTTVTTITGNITGSSSNTITFKNPVIFDNVSSSSINNTTATFEKTCTVKNTFEFGSQGSATIKDLKMEGVTGTLTVNSDISITGDMILKGVDGGLLNIAGSAKITLSSNQDTGDYLSINSATAPTLSGGYYLTKNSTSDDKATVLTKGWILGNLNDIYWIGTTSNDWTTDTNWLPKAPPASTNNVIITTGRTNYPILSTTDSSATTIKSLVMEENTSLAATTELIITDAVDFNNTITLAGLFNDTNGITTSGTISISDDATFTGDVTNTGSISIASGKKLSINNDLDDENGTALTGTICFTGTGAQTFKAKTDSSYDIISNSTNTVTVKNQMNCSSLTAQSGTIEFEENVEIISYSDDDTGVTPAAGNIIFDNEVLFTATGGTTIKTSGTITATSILKSKGDLTITTGKLTAKGNVIAIEDTTYKQIKANKIEIDCADDSEVTIQGSSINISGTVLPTSTGTQSIALKAETGTIIVGTNPKIEIGSAAKKFKNITISTPNDINFDENVTLNASETIAATGKNISFNNYIVGNELRITAQKDIAISGLAAKKLTLNKQPDSKVSFKNGSDTNTTPATPVPIKITENDFIINYPITLTGDTDFEITGTGKKIILESTGSITPNANSTSTTTGYALSLKASQIDLENGIGSSSSSLKSVTFKSPVNFTAADKTIYATTTEFASGSNISNTPAASNSFSIKNDLLISSGADVTFPFEFTVPGSLTNNGTVTFPTAASTGVTIAKNFSDAGTFTGNITFNGSTKSEFTPVAATSYTVDLQKTGNSVLEFTAAVKLASITTNETTYPSSLTFKEGGTLSAATTFKCNVDLTGTLTASAGVSFADDADLLTHDSGTPAIYASITGATSFNSMNITGDGLDVTDDAEVIAGKILNLGTELTTTTGFTVNGTLTIPTTTATATIGGAGSLTNNGTINIPENKTLICNTDFTNSSDSTVSGKGNSTFTKNFTDSGKWTNEGTITLSDTAAQIFVPTTDTTSSYAKIIINKTSAGTPTGTVTFETNPLKAGTVQIINNGETIFEAKPVLTLFKDVADNSTTSTAGKITFQSGATITNDVTFYTTADISITGEFNAPNTIFAATNAAATPPLQKLITGASTTFNNLQIAAGASLTTATSFTVKGNWTNKSTITDSFNSTAGTIEFTSEYTSGTTEITGDNTFSTIKFASPSQTVKFQAGKTQTITNIISQGSAADNVNNIPEKRITLTTNAPTPSLTDTNTWWKINLANQPSTADFKYTTIEYSDSQTDIRHDWGETVLEGEPDSTKNWFYRTFYWFGKTDTSWDTPSNWSYTETYTAPGCSSSPLKTTGINEIYIKENDSNVLSLTSDINVKIIEVYDGKKVDFGTCSITTNSIVNKGHVRLAGSQTITKADGNATEITNATNSVVEYYGDCTAILPMSDNQTSPAANYKNLEFTNDANGTISTAITVAGTTLIKNNSDKELTFSSANNIFTGKITIGNHTATPTGAGDIKINSRNILTFNDILCKTITVTPTAVLEKGCTTSDGAIFEKDAIISTTSCIISGSFKADNLAIYEGTVEIAGSATITKDIVLLGTSIDSKYVYAQPRFAGTETGASNNYTAPETVSLTSDSIVLNITSTAPLTAGKNFYAYNATITGKLKLPDNTDSTVCFAEAYNCTVNNSSVECSVPNKNAQIACESCNVDDFSRTNGWDDTELKIEEAYTKRDNAIYIKFNKPVRNKNGELIKVIENSLVTIDSTYKYEGAYTDPDCQTPLPNGDIQEFYLKANTTWNTDAHESSAGTDKSRNSKGEPSTVIPFIDIIKDDATYHWTITDIYGKRINDYNSSNRYKEVADKTGPVLYSVRTGQENHIKNPADQKSYDAHNFIEFCYSEPVSFVLDSTDSTKNITGDSSENIQVTTEFGTITNNANGFTISGIGTIEKGKIETGRRGSLAPDATVNSLYRLDEYSIRISIAGLTDGTVTDQFGKSYKNWVGYIKNASMPEGTVTIASNNPYVIDRATVPNNQHSYATGKTIVPKANKSHKTNYENDYDNFKSTFDDSTLSADEAVYGNWDISSPVFAPLNKISSSWQNLPDGAEHEAIGYNNGSGSTLRKIEFHILDNTPNYADSNEPRWITGRGWVNRGNEELYGKNKEYYCADIYGGSRAFEKDLPEKQKYGGIRYSSLKNSTSAFKYDIGTVSEPSTAFGTTVYYGAGSYVFTGSSSIKHAATDSDGLYFGLELADTNISLKEQFTVQYDKDIGFITDLAGNLLQSKRIKTIDKTPPSFDYILAPVGQDEMYILFVKDLQIDAAQLSYWANATTTIPIDEDYNSLIPKCFELFSLDYSTGAKNSTPLTLQITDMIGVEKIRNSSNGREFTAIRLKLNRAITLADIENTYIRLIIPSGYSTSYDQDIGLPNSNVTFIQDIIGNYMPIYSAHALSDFAINIINPKYAYDEDMTYAEEYIMNGLYENGSWAVHDWNRDQVNYGSMPANHNYNIVTEITDEISSPNTKTKGAKLFISGSPTSGSESNQINEDIKSNYRVWTPEGAFTFLAPYNNTSVDSITNLLNLSSPNPSYLFEYHLPDTISKKWNVNKQISFMFGLVDENSDPVEIYTSLHNIDANNYNLSISNKVPLYALRLENPADITSIDLWSFKVRGITEQRGGVTILNNVIDASNGEKVALKIDLKSAGNLNVMIMTLDGNIVSYLNHGHTSAGEHYFSWDGRNKNGNSVARGMYFIRIVGNGIDETRKVMVVK